MTDLDRLDAPSTRKTPEPLTGDEEALLWNFYVHRTVTRLPAELSGGEVIRRLLVTLDRERSEARR